MNLFNCKILFPYLGRLNEPLLDCNFKIFKLSKLDLQESLMKFEDMIWIMLSLWPINGQLISSNCWNDLKMKPMKHWDLWIFQTDTPYKRHNNWTGETKALLPSVNWQVSKYGYVSKVTQLSIYELLSRIKPWNFGSFRPFGFHGDDDGYIQRRGPSW